MTVLKKILSRNHSGMCNWLLQRATALVMALYSLCMAASLASHRPGSFQAWREMFSPLWVRLATLLFCASLMLHAWLGIRDILMDYVPTHRVKKMLQMLVDAALLGYSAWAAIILWRI